MTRRHRGKTQLGVSLFPFLAVLICTMGALIVLLLLVMQQAQAQAKQVATSQPTAEETAAAAAKLAVEREDAQWRHDALAEQRAKKAEELADQRLALAHLEDHIRRLQEQWQDLESQAAQLHSQGSEKQHSHEKVAGEIAAVREQIDAAKSELASAQAAAKTSRPRSFSIIPYDGPNGTSRRPIYVECTAERILIQPEGVALDARDFQGPLGPGNSLDACLRAIREYFARSPEHARAGEPYPLLIVRPNGIVAYAAARSAMKSWEDEFGYELIEDDTVLAYPQPNPTLKRLLERAIVEARRRQLLLAAAAPSRYRGGGGGGAGGQPFGGFEALMADDPYVNPGTGDGGSFDGTGTGKGSGQPGEIGGESTGQRGGAAGSTASGGFYSPNYRGGSRGNSSSAGSENTAENGNTSAGKAARGQSTSNQATSGQRGNGPSGRVPPGAQGVTGPAISSAGGESGESSDASTSSNASSHKPIAHQRGANWGLPNYSQRAVGITRPVRVRVSADQLEILPERGTAGAIHKVPIRDSMSLATQHLVEQIGEEVNGWGIAVSNGYWKPVLNIETATGGEARVAELETLLQGSGLGLRRK